MKSFATGLLLFALSCCPAISLVGAEPVTLENVVTPEPNRADEPLAEQFSMSQALHFLDSASLDWQQSWQCFTCHTNISYLIARPTVAADAPAHRAVRKYAEELVSLRWDEVGARFDAEVVAIAAALALNDAATTKKLHPLTKLSLDRMWQDQRPAGDWKWPTGCRWPPMESDEHYGVTLAAIGVGAAPDGYALTPAAQAGLAKIRTYLQNNPPPTLHHRAMILWASTYVDELMTKDEQQACITDLLAEQRPDGGWAFSRLYPWDRDDDGEQDLESSDGYGTGFCVFVLRKAGVSADDPAMARGAKWLKTHQRVSGRWFTRSLNKDNEHYISHAGSAYAVMALSLSGVTLEATADVAAGLTGRKANDAGTIGVKLDAASPAVKAYQAEQQRRRELRLTGLRQKIDKSQNDPAEQSLLPVLKQQLADLESKPLEPVNFEATYQYPPTTDRVGYSKRVRLLDNTADGKSVILVDNTALVVGGLGTEQFESGKFFGIEKALLVGSQRADFTWRNKSLKCYDAVLVDLEAVLKGTP